MAVTSLKEYIGVARDCVENYGGKQIVYLSWDHHLLFAAPLMLCLPPATPFGEVLRGPLAALLQADPDAAALDWNEVEWLKDNQPFVPDPSLSLADNGIGHKDQLRFRTPGLNTLLAAA